jgi:hypothetical protein
MDDKQEFINFHCIMRINIHLKIESYKENGELINFINNI